MKVLAAIVVPPHLSVSGAARAALELSSALAGHCDMSVASMMAAGHGASLKEVPVRTWLPPVLPWSRLPNRFSTLFYRSDLGKLVGQRKYDIVHLHNPMPALELERTANACRAAKIPYVVSTHGFNEVARGGEVYGFGSVKKLMWKRLVSDPVSRVVKHAAAVFALSPADFEIVRDMGFTGSNLSVVSNGVVPPAAGDREDDSATLDRLGISANRETGQITCMFLANHTPNKGLPVLLAAFSALERPYLLIVGGEKRDNIDYDKYIRACRPGQRIVVTGRLSDGEVTALFRRSDLFVFPTLADTFPLVVLEAMSHGLPVLASRVGGIPYQLDDRCGVLVAPGESTAISAAVEKLARYPARLLSMGRQARQRVAGSFTWERAAVDAMDGYRRVLQ